MYFVRKYLAKNKEFTFIEVKQKDIKVTFMDYGAAILSIFVPDNEGTMETVLLAYNSLDSYIENDMYLNMVVGPTSGRIQEGKFTIGNKTHQLDVGKEGFNLHGGKEGISYRFFHYDIQDRDGETKVVFTYKKEENDSNYPGNVPMRITYTVTEGNIMVEYSATTDKDTILNLTQHAYFNLSGCLKLDCLDQEIYIDADHYIELEDFIPTTITPVEGSHLNFKTLSPLKEHLPKGYKKTDVKGVDHPFLLNNPGMENIAASMVDPISGRQLNVYTTYPSIVCYSHNYPDDKELLFDRKHKMHMAVCFEAQLPPNSMHIDGLSDQILHKGEHYYHKTRFEFTLKE